MSTTRRRPRIRLYRWSFGPGPGRIVIDVSVKPRGVPLPYVARRALALATRSAPLRGVRNHLRLESGSFEDAPNGTIWRLEYVRGRRHP
ncbi:hypothetical protein [Herbidospora daliensis]|uniref:hypothetical protein n=1 Tax=Herbidospora daliensis TaxID=295585 RepID=UPI000783DD6F|nr:hypothetical protein [Herbidospora daliensis]